MNGTVLIACEESQAVTIEFRRLGVEAYSCDIQEQSGGHPEWHIKDDVLKIIGSEDWKIMIAFPPCTHIAVSGGAWFEEKRKDGRQQEGIDFFLKMCNAPIQKKAIENPVSIMSTVYRKPDQIIQPYYFGDSINKTTCIWLFGLPKLLHVKTPDLFSSQTHVEKEAPKYVSKKGENIYSLQALSGGLKDRKKIRSKTFPGIAKAMAEQWSRELDRTETKYYLHA